MLFEKKIETFEDFLSESYFFNLAPLKLSDFRPFNYGPFDEAFERTVDINGKRYVILLSKSHKDGKSFFSIDFNVGSWGEAYVQNLSKEDYALLKAELKRTLEFGEKKYKGLLFKFTTTYNSFKNRAEKEQKIENLTFDDIQLKDTPILIDGMAIVVDSNSRKIIDKNSNREISIGEFKNIIRSRPFNPQIEKCLNGEKKYNQRVLIYDRALKELGYIFIGEEDGNYYYKKETVAD